MQVRCRTCIIHETKKKSHLHVSKRDRCTHNLYQICRQLSRRRNKSCKHINVRFAFVLETGGDIRVRDQRKSLRYARVEDVRLGHVLQES